MPDLTPEQRVREQIDAMLQASGWDVQSKDAVNLSAARGVAIRELSFKTGAPDYTLFVDGKSLGTVEAKPEGWTLRGVEAQSGKYTTGLALGMPFWRDPLPFAYESTGVETHFTNKLEPDARSRSVFAFHRPETLLALEQQPVLAPFAESVDARFNEWLMDKAKAGVTFTPEQLAWLNLIRDHIATSLSIEPEDLELSPFNQRGGLGKAHQLFGNDLNRILDELNLTLVA